MMGDEPTHVLAMSNWQQDPEAGIWEADFGPFTLTAICYASGDPFGERDDWKWRCEWDEADGCRYEESGTAPTDLVARASAESAAAEVLRDWLSEYTRVVRPGTIDDATRHPGDRKGGE